MAGDPQLSVSCNLQGGGLWGTSEGVEGLGVEGAREEGAREEGLCLGLRGGRMVLVDA